MSSPSGLLSGLAWWIGQPVFSQPPSVRIYLIFVYKPIHLHARTIVPANRVLQGVTAFPWTLSLDAIRIEARHPVAKNNKKKQVKFVLRNFWVRVRREISVKCSYKKGYLSIADWFPVRECIRDLNPTFFFCLKLKGRRDRERRRQFGIISDGMLASKVVDITISRFPREAPAPSTVQPRRYVLKTLHSLPTDCLEEKRLKVWAVAHEVSFDFSPRDKPSPFYFFFILGNGIGVH